MEFPLTSFLRPFLSKLFAYLFDRPRIDLDIQNNPEDLYGQKSKGASAIQSLPKPIPVPYVKHDFEFYWNFKLRIKNNSSVIAYNIKFIKITKHTNDYLEPLDELLSLSEGESIDLDYIIIYKSSKNIKEAELFMGKFPSHLEKLEIIVSYTNEGQKIFYTRFIATKANKSNEHLLKKT